MKKQKLSQSGNPPTLWWDLITAAGPFETPLSITSLFSDPIDIVSVTGYKGFQEFLRLGEDLPIRIFQVVPGGLPVDTKFSNSKTLSLSQEKSAVKHPHVLGLGEVFSWTKVTLREPKTMKSLSTMLECDCIINGHTAGISEKKTQCICFIRDTLLSRTN